MVHVEVDAAIGGFLLFFLPRQSNFTIAPRSAAAPVLLDRSGTIMQSTNSISHFDLSKMHRKKIVCVCVLVCDRVRYIISHFVD